MRNASAMRQLLRMFSATTAVSDAELEPLPITIDPSAGPSELVDAFVAEAEWWYARPLLKPPAARQTGTGRAILALPAAIQLTVLYEALRRAVQTPLSKTTISRPYAVVDCAAMLLARDLDYSDRDLQTILELLIQLSTGAMLGAPLFQALLPHLEKQAAGSGLAPETADLVRRELALVSGFATGPEYGRLLARVTELLSPSEAGLPEADEPWSEAMLASLRAMDHESFAAWQQILAHAMRAEQSKPTAKWLKEADSRVAQLGFERFRASVLPWFSSLEAPATMPLSQHNGQLIKGLAWACSSYGDAELAGALGRLAEAMLHWIPQFPAMDWRCLRAGNASLHALGTMPGDEPVVQLSRLSVRLKGKQLQDSIGKAIAAACQRRGMTREDLEELVVPKLSDDVDDAQPDAKKSSGAASPARQNLAAQRFRLERLLPANRSWSFAEWKQRYADQSLLSPMVSRLVWWFELPGERADLATYGKDAAIDVAGRKLPIDSSSTSVRIWHPIESDAATVDLWRRFLEDRRIVQPFKQAHREVYRVTEGDAESAMGSGRFAGHIIRQDRFKALCDERDWRYHIQGRYVRGAGIAMRNLDDWQIRAELAVKPTSVDPENGAGATFYRFLTTGRVRFLYEDGNICAPHQVPDVAFSEVMRDVDLFVGICSIGVDPAWSDRRGQDAYGDYWRNYAFAELTEAAAVRRETLVHLLPSLSIASRCTVEGRFLVVRGDLRTYKIHIGSGNVLMSPNDMFLPFPHPRGGAEKNEQVFLPFEGDTMLAQILSKAAVLADDRHISDRALRNAMVNQ